jgi:hypothetical protein
MVGWLRVVAFFGEERSESTLSAFGAKGFVQAGHLFVTCKRVVWLSPQRPIESTAGE